MLGSAKYSVKDAASGINAKAQVVTPTLRILAHIGKIILETRCPQVNLFCSLQGRRPASQHANRSVIFRCYEGTVVGFLHMLILSFL